MLLDKKKFLIVEELNYNNEWPIELLFHKTCATDNTKFLLL